MNPATEPTRTPARLLVRGVNWLGDAVMTTPALLRLREALPQTHIALLTPAKLHDLWAQHPAVDEVLPTQRGESPWAVGRKLRSGNFDAALILPNSPRSALECLLAGIPLRVGYARGWRRFLLTRAIPSRSGSVPMRKPSRSEIERRLQGKVVAPTLGREVHHSFDYLRLAAAFGASQEPMVPSLRVLDEERRAARAKFGMDGEGLWLGLNPGAEYGPAKRWPVERYTDLARRVSAERGVRWVLFGGPADREATARIARDLPGAIDLAGRTTLRELMSVLAEVRVLLTNDTGPMHVAAGLGTPVVVPFGSTSPEMTGPGEPGSSSHRLIRIGAPCAPCFLRECPIDFRCMTGISVERVAEEVRAAVGGG